MLCKRIYCLEEVPTGFPLVLGRRLTGILLGKIPLSSSDHARWHPRGTAMARLTGVYGPISRVALDVSPKACPLLCDYFASHTVAGRRAEDCVSLLDTLLHALPAQ